MDIRLMVFDVAGTTVSDDDNAVAGRLCDALKAAGLPAVEADVNPVMGLYKPLAIKLLVEKYTGKTPVDEEVRRLYQDFERRIVNHYRTAPNVRALPGVEDLFRALRARGVKIGLDTGFDRVVLDAILDRLGWWSIVDGSVTSDEVANGRPHPDMIQVLMKRFGVTDPKQVGKAGDSLSDIEEGLAAGCGLIAGVLCERTRGVGARFPGVHMVAGVGELLPIITGATAEAVS